MAAKSTELLNWSASQMMNNGVFDYRTVAQFWDIAALDRLIVTKNHEVWKVGKGFSIFIAKLDAKGKARCDRFVKLLSE